MKHPFNQMFNIKHKVRRFSLLLLDEGEQYVKDWVAHCCWPDEIAGNWQHAAKLPGQLRLCTASLFFEPDDLRIPIIRLPFASIQGLEGNGEQSLSVAALRVVRMKPNAADVPYQVDRDVASSWRFELAYAGLDEFMPLAQQMLVASRMQGEEQEAFLEAFLQQREAGLHFDAAHLRSPALEHLSLDLPATCLTPLVSQPGRVAVSDARLYFQPQHNVVGDAPVLSHPLAAVAAVARRRSSLRDIGAEVFFYQPDPSQCGGGVAPPFWAAPSAFFSFRSREERERFVGAVLRQPALGEGLPGGRGGAEACRSILEAEGGWVRRVTSAWQLGHISNFQYLMFCNLAAGRSFNDLTQYPVFPWVVADYESSRLDLEDPSSFRDLSLPVGALNPVRLGMFQRRFAEMLEGDPTTGPPFLYGSHYSCPGYVMFWLVRAAPAHMLRLQNGRFDAPDRLFWSVASSWGSVLTNPTDVKELIPEFYMHNPEFLVNRHKLPLGSRQNGRAVGDVELPPWAEGSPSLFLAALRAALEAPFVSANLHHWIDLIFGYQQQGPAAVEANNVFRHLTYEGAVDTEAVTDRLERASLQTQVNEFGQCPRQLFKQPHPPRLVCPPPPAIQAPKAAQGGVQAPQQGVAGGMGVVGGGDGQDLSLALVNTLVAAVSASTAPPALEVPPLLLELNMVRRRQEEERRDREAHGPVVSRARVMVEEFHGGARRGAPPPHPTGDTPSAVPASSSASASSPAPAFSRLRSWAGERGAGRLGALTEAVGGAVVGAVQSDRAASIRGLFKRVSSGGRSTGGGGSSGAGKSSAALAGEGGVSTARGGAAARGEAVAVGAVSQGEAAGGASEGEGGGGGRAAAVAAGQDVLAGLMRWKYASRQAPPSDSEQEEEGGSEAAGGGGGRGGVHVLVTDAEGQGAGSVLEGSPGPAPAVPAAPAALSPRDCLVEQQRQRMLGERSATPLHSPQPQSTPKQRQQQPQQGGGRHGEAVAAGPAAAVAGAAGAHPSTPTAAGQPPSTPHGPTAQQAQQGTREDARRGALRAAGKAPSASMCPEPPNLAEEACQDGERDGQAPPTPPSPTLPVGWGPGLRERLHSRGVLLAGGEAVAAVAVAEGVRAAAGGGRERERCVAVYCAGHGGWLKIFDALTGKLLRACSVSPQPLATLALLPQPPLPPPIPGDPHPQPPAPPLPLALCGSYDGRVYAYCQNLGRVTADLEAHQDTVSCMGILKWGGGGTAGWEVVLLATGCWDGSVKVWELGGGGDEGVWGARPGSARPAPRLLCTLGELPGGVWALVGGMGGGRALLVAGTEDGWVTAWDLVPLLQTLAPPRTTRSGSGRSGSRAPGAGATPSKLWEVAVSDDYIGGLSLTPGAHHVLVAAADGTLSLLGVGSGGAVVASVACGPPLRCCTTDGELALAGGEDGGVYFWDLALAQGRVPAGGGRAAPLGWVPPGPDGLYQPLHCRPPSAANALAVVWAGEGGAGRGPKRVAEGREGAQLWVVTGHEEGAVRVHCA